MAPRERGFGNRMRVIKKQGGLEKIKKIKGMRKHIL